MSIHFFTVPPDNYMSAGNRHSSAPNRNLKNRNMGKQKPVDLSEIKPTARKRTALSRESAFRARKSHQYTSAASILSTDNPGLLQPENDLEETLKLRQSHILPHLDPSTTTTASFTLDLSHSRLTPYINASFSRSSRSLLVASKKGHLAVSTWRSATLSTELYLNETIRGATFFHNDQLFATSQKNCAYIYDSSGAHIHSLRTHRDPASIKFLPHHLLLVTASAPFADHSRLVYTDVTIGDVVANHNFGARQLRLGKCADMSYNPASGVVCLGHASGVVSMWSPVSSQPLARMLTHAGGVRHLAVGQNGYWMATTGGDGSVKLWDLRTYKMICGWKTGALPTALAVSQRDLIALSIGATVQIWAPGGATAGSASEKHNGWGEKPYMLETFSGCRVTALDFCPFEDVLSVCHQDGVRMMIVPGAGEATFDTNAPNPYETRKQRREDEVRSLLDRLPPSSIVLDRDFIGSVEKDPEVRLQEIRDRQRTANLEKLRKKREKNKAKGRNKIGKRLKRKQKNVIDAKRLELEDKLEQRRKQRETVEKVKERERQARKEGGAEGPLEDDLPEALDRFIKNKKKI